MIRQWFAVLLALALAGCAAMSVAASLPSGDTRNWKTYQVEVGDQVIQFTIPPGVSKDFLDPPVPSQIDLQQPGLFDKTGRGPRILSRHWDYRSSPFALVDGTLNAVIWVKYSEKSLIDLSALQLVVSEGQELSRMKDLVKGGYTGPPNPPTKFDSANVGGRQGLYVHYQTSLPDYVVAIASHHYLVIYIDSSGVSRPDWRADAKAAADAILRSIQIEPKS
jgi:hypothetical protein